MTQGTGAGATQAPGSAVQGTTPGANVISTAQLTPRDLEALKARRSELSDLLRNVTGRRKEVQNSLRSATTAADRAGLEQRLGVLDQRIARIEVEIEENSRTLTSLEAMRTTTAAVPPRPPRTGRNVDPTPILVCLVLFVLSPIAIAISRNLWKRGSRPTAMSNPENSERMLRMEQAIDSIAIEIERVSEGQRFVTRLLAEGRLPNQVGNAQPIAEALPLSVTKR